MRHKTKYKTFCKTYSTLAHSFIDKYIDLYDEGLSHKEVIQKAKTDFEKEMKNILPESKEYDKYLGALNYFNWFL